MKRLVEHITSSSNSQIVEQSLESGLLSGHWQSSSEIPHYGLNVLLTTRQSDLGKINGI